MLHDCVGDRCASWEKAKIYLTNPGRMHDEQSIYDINYGYCRNPGITSKIYISKSKSF